jgi:PKD repeat protein
MIGPFTTLIGLVLIVWGAVKINNALRDTGANRAGGLVHDLWSRFTSQTPTTVTAAFAAPPTVTAGTPATFRGSATGGTGSYTYAWTFSDPAGGPAGTATSPTPTHTYATDGPSTVELIVTDSAGTASAPHRLPITVNPAGGGLTPNIVVHEIDNTGPVIPPAGSTMAGDVFFDASATTGGTAPYTFAWTFSTPPASLPGNVATFTADYSSIGVLTPITVDLTVTDIVGATNTISYNFEVTP